MSVGENIVGGETSESPRVMLSHSSYMAVRTGPNKYVRAFHKPYRTFLDWQSGQSFWKDSYSSFLSDFKSKPIIILKNHLDQLVFDWCKYWPIRLPYFIWRWHWRWNTFINIVWMISAGGSRVYWRSIWKMLQLVIFGGTNQIVFWFFYCQWLWWRCRARWLFKMARSRTWSIRWSVCWFNWSAGRCRKMPPETVLKWVICYESYSVSTPIWVICYNEEKGNTLKSSSN